ncbi:MAG TPA: hypothetical protein VFE42_03710 [Chloroflexota bacterium]|jgi:hypothetical protein|nr:hypothetical protein [Chloroflexota bacterium]
MKRTTVVTCAILGALLLVLQSYAPLGSAARRPAHVQKQSGSITIESWLHATPDKNGLSGTVTACFKLTGAFDDHGGAPNWSESTYTDTTSLADKCGDWQPVGGFVFVPPVKGTDTTVYAIHTITGQKGQMFITFSGTYDLVKTYRTTSCTWVITGGTGYYKGIQGAGTCAADASTFPYIRHTETGQLWRS